MVSVLDQTMLIDEPEYQSMSVHYVPDTGELKMPEDPDIFEAYKLQRLCLKMEKIQETLPGQFNAAVYRRTLDDLMIILRRIKEKNRGENERIADLDARSMGQDGTGGDPEEMGAGEFSELDLGISAKNPFSR